MTATLIFRSAMIISQSFIRFGGALILAYILAAPKELLTRGEDAAAANPMSLAISSYSANSPGGMYLITG